MATKLSHRASTGSSMSNHRPKSRQSTTSVQSNTSQLVHALQTDQPFDAPQPPMPSEVWQQHERSMNQISHGIPGYHSLSADASSVQHANVPFPTDNSFGGPLRMDSPADYMSIEGQDDSLMDGTSQLQTAGGTTGDGSRRKKASSSGQANDQELRRLFRENENKSLHEIAQQVLKDDKGPKSEKNRQIFGMIWYDTKKSNSNRKCH